MSALGGETLTGAETFTGSGRTTTGASLLVATGAGAGVACAGASSAAAYWVGRPDDHDEYSPLPPVTVTRTSDPLRFTSYGCFASSSMTTRTTLVRYCEYRTLVMPPRATLSYVRCDMSRLAPFRSTTTRAGASSVKSCTSTAALTPITTSAFPDDGTTLTE